MYSDILQIDGESLPKLPEEEEAVGIITMEDVIEELLQVRTNSSTFVTELLSLAISHETPCILTSTISLLFRRRSLTRRIITFRSQKANSS